MPEEYTINEYRRLILRGGLLLEKPAEPDVGDIYWHDGELMRWDGEADVPIGAGEFLTQAEADGLYLSLGAAAGFPDSDGQPATKLPQTDGEGGWTFIDPPTGVGGNIAYASEFLTGSEFADGITDNHEALQAALDAAAGGVLYLDPDSGGGTDYRTSQPLLVPGDTTIEGFSIGRGATGTGSSIGVHSSYSIEDFRAMGILTARAYADNAADFDDPVIISNLKIDGGGNDVNGIVLFNRRLRVHNVQIIDVGSEANRQDWNAAAGQGIGYGIVCTEFNSNGVQASGNAVNPIFSTMRVGAQHSRLLVDSSSGKWTDGRIDEWENLIQHDGFSNVDSVDINDSAGWLIENFHGNGCGGASIRISNTLRTRISNCDLDGWGLGAQDQFRTFAILVRGFSLGTGGTNLTIENIIGRARSEQSGSSIDDFVFVDDQDPGVDARVTISGLNMYLQTGTANVKGIRLDGDEMYVTVTGCNLGLAHDDIWDLAGSVDPPPLLIEEGNSWQASDVVPTATAIPVGERVWNANPGATEPLGWVFDGGAWLEMAQLVA